MRRLLIVAASVAAIAYLAGCGGGGGGGGSTTYTGTAQIGFSGGGGGGAPTSIVLTIDRVEIRPAGSSTYSSAWTGSSTFDVLQSTPTFCSVTAQLGADVMESCDSFRFHVSHVHILDAVNGDLDAAANITLTFDAHVQLAGGRTAQVWLIVTSSALSRNGNIVTISHDQILQDNNIAPGGLVKSYWADCAMMDLTHLGTTLKLPDGTTNVTGMWFNGDTGGPYVEQSSSGGDFYRIDTGSFQQGSYTYNDSSKATGTYSILASGFTHTGNWAALGSLVTLPTSKWVVVASPESDGGTGLFAFFNLDAQGHIIGFYPGDFTLNDAHNPTAGGTFRTYPAQEMLSTQGPHTFYFGTFTMTSSMLGGSYTFNSTYPAGLTSNGSWQMFVPTAR